MMSQLTLETSLNSISSLDEFGFEVRPYFYWIPETIEDEIARLEMNLLKYEQYIFNGSRFLEKINRTRLDEFNRLSVLRTRAA